MHSDACSLQYILIQSSNFLTEVFSLTAPDTSGFQLISMLDRVSAVYRPVVSVIELQGACAGPISYEVSSDLLAKNGDQTTSML